ncbi:MAG: hypothetical protein AAF745_01580 [Planctomycetota bacterium]
MNQSAPLTLGNHGSLLALVPLLACLVVGQISAADVLRSGLVASETWRATPLTLSVEAQDWTQVVNQIFDFRDASQLGSSVSKTTPWIGHRKIDPQLRVRLQARPGATLGSHLAKIAEQLDLAVFPVSDIVVLGPPTWIEQLLQQADSLPDDDPDKITVTWADGVTAAQIFEAITACPSDASVALSVDPDGAEARQRGWFPHDVWRAGDWTLIDRRLAALMLLTQFDLGWSNASSWKSLRYLSVNQRERPTQIQWLDPAAPRLNRISLTYPGNPDFAKQIETWINESELQASIAAIRGGVRVIGPAASHRLITMRRWATSTRNKAASSRPSSSQTNASPLFTLELVRRPADDVLNQLSAALGKQCVFTDSAEARRKEPVTFTVQDMTLNDLIKKVCREVGLTVDIHKTKVVISGPQ